MSKQCAGKQCLGFEFSASGTRIAVGKFTSKGAEISRLLQMQNKEHPDASDPGSTDAAARELRRFLTDEGVRLKGSPALAVLSSGQYICREVDIPYMPEESERDGLAAFRMSEVLSLNVDDYYFKHAVTRRYKNGEREMCSAITVAVSKKTCGAYYGICTAMGLIPTVLDVDITGMERCLASQYREYAAGTVACIDYGIHRTKADIFENGNFVQNATLEWGENDLMEQVEKILRRNGDPGDPSACTPEQVYRLIVSGKEDPDTAELRSKLTRWAKELSDVLTMYRLNSGGKEVSCIILQGENRQFSWFRSYLEHALKIRILIAEKPAGIVLKGQAQKNAGMVPLFLNSINLFSIR